MPVHDFTAQRLFIDAPLSGGAEIACGPDQANYLLNVLRLGPGDTILVFNGRDGEWQARIEGRSKRGCTLAISAQSRPQHGGPDIDYLFAPLKRARLDFMVQKATELGVARLCPVITRHTIAERVNLERMRANAIEAAEQCGILRVPQVAEPRKLEHVLDAWDETRTLVFCDEAAPIADPIEALRMRFQAAIGGTGHSHIAVLVGPEGGFESGERQLLLGRPYTLALSLGPRIMRADTAAVAVLALVNAVAGDWR